jgi:hypothetical protein
MRAATMQTVMTDVATLMLTGVVVRVSRAVAGMVVRVSRAVAAIVTMAAGRVETSRQLSVVAWKAASLGSVLLTSR